MIAQLLRTSALLTVVTGTLSFAQAQPPSSAQAQLPVQYNYEVLAQKPQPRQNFVQGLQIVDEQLYVSTGGYGESKLLRYRFSDGSLLDEHALDARLFGEGITVLGEEVYQLTWRAGLVFSYRKRDFQPQRWFRIPTQGWGLTDNGSELIYSDGSSQLYFLDPKTGLRLGDLNVTEGGKALAHLNELEWIEGKIWANGWLTDRVVIIDPASGNVEGSIDFSGLLPADQRRRDTDVLNGIAHNPSDGSLWVTGKRWPWLYQVAVSPRTAKSSTNSTASSDSNKQTTAETKGNSR